jgi:SulP family sulfate permease
MLESVVGRWSSIGNLTMETFARLLMPAATLAVLLSIDTLKTCVVLDALTRSRHNSNRELVGQGLGNIAASVLGGVPGAGTMGATLVNISSGAQSRVSSVMEGVLALVAFLLLGSFIAWVPIAALAGILIVIGVRMIDRSSLQLLKSRPTILDFAVIAAVIVTALTVSLIAASGVGIALAVVLFIREQIGGAVVRRKAFGNQMFSKQVRLPAEMAILEKRGAGAVIFELQGSLFFGTTDQLYTALEPELKTCSYLILDMHRVQSVDVTAAHMLEQIEDTLAERKAVLLFSALPRDLPSGRDMRTYFDQVGLVRPGHHVKPFDELDEALEWVEDRFIAAENIERAMETALELRDIDLFRSRKAETLAALEAVMEKRSAKAGEAIFNRGETGDELFLIRRGAVRVVLPLPGGQARHLATFSRGDFIGEMAFLDHHVRSANAVAFTDTDLFVLSRKRFDALAEEHRMLAINLLEGIARVLAIRLRYANAELEST